MTLSLEGYLEPSRMSLITPYLPLHQPITSPSEDSFPVFSPPPYSALRERGTIMKSTNGHDIGPPWLRDRMAMHRPSLASLSPCVSHHTCNYQLPRRRSFRFQLQFISIFILYFNTFVFQRLVFEEK